MNVYPLNPAIPSAQIDGSQVIALNPQNSQEFCKVGRTTITNVTVNYPAPAQEHPGLLPTSQPQASLVLSGYTPSRNPFAAAGNKLQFTELPAISLSRADDFLPSRVADEVRASAHRLADSNMQTEAQRTNPTNHFRHSPTASEWTGPNNDYDRLYIQNSHPERANTTYPTPAERSLAAERQASEIHQLRANIQASRPGISSVQALSEARIQSDRNEQLRVTISDHLYGLDPELGRQHANIRAADYVHTHPALPGQDLTSVPLHFFQPQEIRSTQPTTPATQDDIWGPAPLDITSTAHYSDDDWASISEFRTGLTEVLGETYDHYTPRDAERAAERFVDSLTQSHPESLPHIADRAITSSSVLEGFAQQADALYTLGEAIPPSSASAAADSLAQQSFPAGSSYTTSAPVLPVPDAASALVPVQPVIGPTASPIGKGFGA